MSCVSLCCLPNVFESSLDFHPHFRAAFVAQRLVTCFVWAMWVLRWILVVSQLPSLHAGWAETINLAGMQRTLSQMILGLIYVWHILIIYIHIYHIYLLIYFEYVHFLKKPNCTYCQYFFMAVEQQFEKERERVREKEKTGSEADRPPDRQTYRQTASQADRQILTGR